jgi:hypothetical protein
LRQKSLQVGHRAMPWRMVQVRLHHQEIRRAVPSAWRSTTTPGPPCCAFVHVNLPSSSPWMRSGAGCGMSWGM